MNQFKTVRALVKANLQVSMTYKINFMLGIISTLILIFVHYSLWFKIYDGNQAETIGGYTFIEMMVYVIMVRVLYVFVNSLNIEEKVSKEIKDGDISIFLTKRINYLLYNVASKLFFSFILLRNINIIPELPILILVFFTAILGLALNTLIGYIFALLAFWMEQVSIMFVFKKNLLNFISGVWIPISMFPDVLKNVLAFLPFNYLQYFSVAIFQQTISTHELIQGLIIQISWLTILLFLSQIIWKRGVIKFTSVGG